MKYIKIQFTKGLDCQAYQVIDENMCVVAYVDLQCQPLELPQVVESHVVDPTMLDSCNPQ
jgi:hypothetical protein